MAHIFCNNKLHRIADKETKKGCKKDVRYLSTLFRGLNFDFPGPFINFSSDDTKNTLELYAEDDNYRNTDCIAIMMMGFSSDKGICFLIGDEVHIMEFVGLVKRSRLYKNKPKLFLFTLPGCMVSHPPVDHIFSLFLMALLSAIELNKELQNYNLGDVYLNSVSPNNNVSHSSSSKQKSWWPSMTTFEIAQEPVV